MTPACQGDDEQGLCPECWLREYISQVGLEAALTDELEWEGRGHKNTTITLSGHMVSEPYMGSDYGTEWDERFVVVNALVEVDS